MNRGDLEGNWAEVGNGFAAFDGGFGAVGDDAGDDGDAAFGFFHGPFGEGVDFLVGEGVAFACAACDGDAVDACGFDEVIDFFAKCAFVDGVVIFEGCDHGRDDAVDLLHRNLNPPVSPFGRGR